MLGSIIAERMKSFYMGKLYPLVICALIFAGHVLGIEVFLLPVIVLIASVSFWVCDSIRPVFVPLCTFLFAFSSENSLFGTVSSDYYVTGWRIVVFVLLIFWVFISLCRFFARQRFLFKLFTRKTPLLFPLLILSVAFMLNGIKSGKWVGGNMVYAFFQVVAFLFVYVLFYHGFSDDEGADELSSYFAYVTMLISLLLIGEMLNLLLTTPGIIENGVIIKAKIVFGWGVCNNAGSYISVLIPMNFYGAYRSKHPIWYGLVGVATYLAAILTLSRNALLCSTLAFFCCFITICIIGKRRVMFRFLFLGVMISAAIVSLTYHEVISLALENYSSQGFSDSGRIDIWYNALRHFLEAPIFGNGFHAGLETGTQTAGFIPAMAHNTPIQLLYSMGIVGFLAYFFYRARSLKAFLVNPSMMKSMMGASMLVLLVGGLLDNFVFHIQPIFYYSVAMAIVYRSVKEEWSFSPILKESSSKWQISAYNRK